METTTNIKARPLAELEAADARVADLRTRVARAGDDVAAAEDALARARSAYAESRTDAKWTAVLDAEKKLSQESTVYVELTGQLAKAEQRASAASRAAFDEAVADASSDALMASLAPELAELHAMYQRLGAIYAQCDAKLQEHTKRTRAAFELAERSGGDGRRIARLDTAEMLLRVRGVLSFVLAEDPSMSESAAWLLPHARETRTFDELAGAMGVRRAEQRTPVIVNRVALAEPTST